MLPNTKYKSLKTEIAFIDVKINIGSMKNLFSCSCVILEVCSGVKIIFCFVVI